MTVLKYYIIGVLVCFLISLLFEHLYFGNGRAGTVKLSTIGADFLFSLLSWLGVLGTAFLFVSEWYCGFDQRGVGESLYEYEEKLKEQKRNEKKEKRD